MNEARALTDDFFVAESLLALPPFGIFVIRGATDELQVRARTAHTLGGARVRTVNLGF